MYKYALVVAGGTGQRFGSPTPKQFLTLKGLPILYHTIKAFYEYDKNIHIIVTLPKDYLELWEDLIKEYKIAVPHQKVIGGENRFHSVKNGLEAIIEDEGLVAIHDAVRPLVSQTTIQHCFDTAAHMGNAIPVISPVDSVRQLIHDTSHPINRSEIFLVQTPQVFAVEAIKKAYSIPYNPEFTDDAIVFEKSGNRIILVEGNRENIKITTQTDLIIA